MDFYSRKMVPKRLIIVMRDPLHVLDALRSSAKPIFKPVWFLPCT